MVNNEQDSPVSEVDLNSADWNPTTARRVIGVATGNAKQLLDAVWNSPNFSVAEHEAMRVCLKKR